MRVLVALMLSACLMSTAGCAAVDVLPEGQRSAHFLPTAKHLDLGGTVFLYADLSGDLKNITAFLSKMFEEVKKENQDPALARIDIAKLVSLLGFDEVLAIGLSSHQDGKLFRNRGFIYHPAPKQGLMRLTGDQARPFETPTWAPADADLVFEQDYNFHGAFQTVEALLRQTMGAEADEILAELNKPIPEMHVSLRQIIEKLDSRLVGVFRIHGDQLLEVPGEEFSFPYTELALGIDGLGFVFDDLVETFGGQPMLKVTADKDFHSITIATSLPGPFALYQPVMAKDVKTGRVWVASSLALLREFVPGPKALGKTKTFLEATRGLPMQGNGLSYMSDRFVGQMLAWLHRLGEVEPEMKEWMGFLDALMPATGVPMASCNGMLPDGLFFASNSNMSHKFTILSLGYANPMAIGIMAAIAIPAFINYRDRARQAQALGSN